MRLTPDATSPNLIGGYSNNAVAAGVSGGTIGGGGAATASNYVAGSFGTVAGGGGNQVAANYGAVSGGYLNAVLGYAAFVGGGYSNHATSSCSAVAGGYGNNANSIYGFVGGGYLNSVSGYGAFVGGGEQNSASGYDASIGGGYQNSALGYEASVGGGYRNSANGSYSFVGGGYSNRATNVYSTVPGGNANLAGGQYSFAAGQNSQALHTGSFVWADFSSVSPFASTAANQFLIRATGGVGIGGAPLDAMLDVEGNARINDFDLFFRGASDRNHGLGWYGPGKTFAGISLDGPALYGYSGGALGTRQNSAENLALFWNAAGAVGIGTTSPGARLHISDAGQMLLQLSGSNSGGTWLNLANTAAGGRAWGFITTGPGNGEGVGKWMLRDHTAGVNRMVVDTNGYVGIGLTGPAAALDVNTGGGRLQVRNEGLTPGLNVVGAGAPGVLRFRNSLEIWPDDGATRLGHLDIRDLSGTAQVSLSGDGTVSTTGSTTVGGKLSFSPATRQMVDLYNSTYGLGVQAWTTYWRTDPEGNFAWYAGGIHNDGEANPGAGGTVRMLLDWHNNLYVNGTFVSSSDRNVKENFLPVDPRAVLEKVVALPLASWNYTNDVTKVRHLGPMAQDFKAAFDLGADDKTIATVDADGVALTAIQGLNQKVEEHRTELTQQQMEITALKAKNQVLEQRLARLEQLLSQSDR